MYTFSSAVRTVRFPLDWRQLDWTAPHGNARATLAAHDILPTLQKCDLLSSCLHGHPNAACRDSRGSLTANHHISPVQSRIPPDTQNGLLVCEGRPDHTNARIRGLEETTYPSLTTTGYPYSRLFSSRSPHVDVHVGLTALSPVSLLQT